MLKILWYIQYHAVEKTQRDKRQEKSDTRTEDITETNISSVRVLGEERVRLMF